MECSNVWWPMECSNVWWPMECSNVWCPMECSNAWVVNGRKRKTSFSPLFIFHPNKFYLIYFSPLILKFYFTMVINHYFTPFLPFPWPINYNHAFQCTNFSTHSSSSWFWLKIFLFPWIHGIAHERILWASRHISEWRIASKIIPKFDIDAPSLWWRSRTAKGVPLSWSRTLSNLVLSHFSKLSHLGDFVASQPCFW